MSRPVPRVRRAAILLASVPWLVVGCSGEAGLDDTQRADAETLVDGLATAAMIDLSAEDRICAGASMSVADLEALLAEPPDLTVAADAVVGCVGEEEIGASVLASQAGSVAPASLACAVGELDRRFIVDLVAGLMADAPPQVLVEIEVARALGVCLELDELLDQ